MQSGLTNVTNKQTSCLFHILTPFGLSARHYIKLLHYCPMLPICTLFRHIAAAKNPFRWVLSAVPAFSFGHSNSTISSKIIRTAEQKKNPVSTFNIYTYLYLHRYAPIDTQIRHKAKPYWLAIIDISFFHTRLIPHTWTLTSGPIPYYVYYIVG